MPIRKFTIFFLGHAYMYKYIYCQIHEIMWSFFNLPIKSRRWLNIVIVVSYAWWFAIEYAFNSFHFKRTLKKTKCTELINLYTTRCSIHSFIFSKRAWQRILQSDWFLAWSGFSYLHMHTYIQTYKHYWSSLSGVFSYNINEKYKLKNYKNTNWNTLIHVAISTLKIEMPFSIY